jgi:hypothetical protein
MMYVVQNCWAYFGFYPTSGMWKFYKRPQHFGDGICLRPQVDGAGFSLRNVVGFCLLHTRLWIESKISPTVLYNMFRPYKAIFRQFSNSAKDGLVRPKLVAIKCDFNDILK